MALVVADRVKETTTTTGTGAISLAGADSNFQAFSDVLSNGDTTYYCIVDATNTEYEIGLGTYDSTGNTLARTTILASSNAGSAVNLAAGQKEIFITYAADKSVYLDASGNLNISGTVTADGSFDLTNAGKIDGDNGYTTTYGKSDNTTGVAIYGGSAYNTGGGFVTYGNQHPSKAGETWFYYDGFANKMVINSTGIDVTGTVTATAFSGSGASLTNVDADLLDGQHGSYYAPASSLSNYLPLAGGTLSGTLNTRDVKLSSDYHLQRSNHHSGHLEGSYNSVGENSDKSNPIYTIGSDFNPSDAALENMYGIGFTHPNSSFINFTGVSGWGMYVAAAGTARIFLSGTNGVVSSTGEHYVGSNVVWNAGNDGSGSGLDADLLDGQQGTYYAPASSLSSYVSKTGDTMTGTLTQSYGGVVWSHSEGTNRPVSQQTWSEAGSIGTTGSNFTDVYGESDLSAIDNNETFDYAGAWSACETHGGRLPTLAELMDGVGSGSGQGYDAEYLWTCTPAGPHHVWVAKGSYSGVSDKKIVDITDPAEVYHTRCFFDVSRANRQVNYDSNGNFTTSGTISSGAIDATEVSVGSVVLGGSGTIAGATWANGEFHLGSSSSGWAMDANELYNSGSGIIGTLSGDLNLNPAGIVTIKGATAWYANNDGSGSGLDADLLDGVQGSSFLRSDAADTSTGLIEFQAGIGAHRQDGVYVTPISKPKSVYWKFTQAAQLDSPPGSGSWRHVATIQTWTTHSGSYPSWQMSFGNGAFGVRQSTSTSAWGGWQTVWTSGNDGSGSGLDADLLDGLQGSSYLRSDTGGTLSGNLTLGGNLEIASGSGGFIKIDQASSSTYDLIIQNAYDYDGWFRLNDGAGSTWFSVGRNNNAYIGGVGTAGNQIWHVGNDGSGSGLDADLLDGQHGSYYQPSSTALTTSTSFGGDVSGTYNAIVVANDSHTHSFNNLTGKTSGAGDYATTGDIVSGKGSGGVALTINDGKGNANITFNHQDGVPEQNGNAARIEVNTDSTSGAAMYFELKSNVSNGVNVDLTPIMTLTETAITAESGKVFSGNGSSLTNVDADTVDGLQASQFLRSDTSDTMSGRLEMGNVLDMNNYDIYGVDQIFHQGDTNTYMQFHAADQWRVVTGGSERLEVNNTAVTIPGTLNVRGAIDLADNDILRFGSGDDAEFFCNGSHMYMDLNGGIGNFYIRDGTATRFTFDDAGHFTATGNITAYSDIRLKEDIKLIEDAVSKVQQLTGNTYTRNDLKDSDRRYGGVIAQEVEVVLPEAVNDSEGGTKTVDYNAMIALLIESIKELKAEVDDLKSQLKEK